jgi:regulator of ribonuclease activity A
MTFSTADLYDAHEKTVQVAEPGLLNYGKRLRFSGPITTLKTYEDNTHVRTALEEPGNGRVLVVDGAGSGHCALLGDRLAELGAKNGWAGVVINGCVRDVATLAGTDLGIRALGSTPRRSEKNNAGQRDIPVAFRGVTFRPGEYLYADEDGILVSPEKLL